MTKLLPVLLACVFAAGCTTASADGSGLAGTVLRGPIQPVCAAGEPCDEPFAALFHVTRGGREVGRFRSDAAGRFAVTLPAGDYLVVPDAGAPLLNPTQQARAVRVEPDAIAQVQLEFDTGIR